MTSSNTDPKYLEYSYYDMAICEYGKYNRLHDEIEELHDIINDKDIRGYEQKIPKDIFNKLHKLMRNGNVSFGNKKESYCIYVNYRLNKEFRDLHNSVDEKIFDILHKFVVTYNIKTTNRKDNTCYGYIKYLNDDIYDRMKILIYLYDLYNQIKPHIVSDNDKLCDILYLMGRTYKDAFDKHNDDNNFFNKLEELKKIIEKNNWATNNQCPVEKYIKLPEKKPPQPIEVPEASNQPRTLTQESLSQDRVRLEDVSGTKDTQEAMIPLRTLEVSESSESLVSYDEHETRATVGSQYSVGPSIPELQANSVYTSSLRAPEPARPAPNQETYISQSTDEFLTDKIIDIPEASITVVYPKTNAIPQEGLMGKIQGAFSNISEYVEPVPLMGVSGVEEDAGIKSLLISEENTLSDFLVFQNMTIDILEINNIIYLTKPNSIYYIIS
ncbi:hypothetical protein PVBG_03309 [Plasmodium vivax Brazil I]|uniref:Variable surface protein n=1 Tax=Plasmodium vivax (strain Brazil I) TaxID=1033975 RepID=A0A0J9VQG8_PLAV1|nr:hypothetical protein PVBG_03309 [Plasmodium vivax Brazil I]